MEIILQENATWVAQMREASCSAVVIIKNRTGDTLFRTDFRLPSGMWRRFPPEMIEPGSHGCFGSESVGFFTGTSGTVTYQMSLDQEPFIFGWDIPFLGSPSAISQSGKNYRIGKEDQLNSKPVTIEYSVHDPYEGDYRNNKSDAKLVTVAPIVYESWKLELKNASLSMLVTLSNTSDFKISLKSEDISHGIWRFKPPELILPGDVFDFGAESYGIMGTKGQIVYSILSKEELKDYTDIIFWWDLGMFSKPIFGSNVFSVEVRVEGYHNEIVLHFSSDELFVLDVKDPEVPKRTLDTATVEEKTGYGFES